MKTAATPSHGRGRRTQNIYDYSTPQSIHSPTTKQSHLAVYCACGGQQCSGVGVKWAPGDHIRVVKEMLRKFTQNRERDPIRAFFIVEIAFYFLCTLRIFGKQASQFQMA